MDRPYRESTHVDSNDPPSHQLRLDQPAYPLGTNGAVTPPPSSASSPVRIIEEENPSTTSENDNEETKVTACQRTTAEFSEEEDGEEANGEGAVSATAATQDVAQEEKEEEEEIAIVQEGRKSLLRIERETFLLFIKILFKLLEDDPSTRSRAEHIVTQCRRRNQNGDPSFQPLMKVVEGHLRHLVGEHRWRRVHQLVHYRLRTTTSSQEGGEHGHLSRTTAVLVGRS